ncbi:hypothetical protein [Acidiphilium sp.]|uniref:hypothetical protein n=1 Tax=Acidiphilium sp. TaxID=527 RepID=UPI003CFC0D4F
MTPSGGFAGSPARGPSFGVILARVVAFTILLGVAALVFWLAVFTVPILMVIGLAGYLYFRFKMARHGGRFGSVTVRHFRR